MDHKIRPWLLFIFALAGIFTVFFFIFRIPALTRQPAGEEGMFYNIFYANPPGPNYLLIGRIEGRDIYTFPEHPALMYEGIRLSGQAWKTVFQPFLINIRSRVFFARIAFVSSQFILFLILLLLSAWKNLASSRGVSAMIQSTVMITLLSITPLAVESACGLQIDGYIGVLLNGLAAVSLYFYAGKLIPVKFARLIVGFTALILGFGKNEWTLAFLAALAFTGLMLLVNRKNGFGNIHVRDEWMLLAIVASGVLLGNLISILFDPLNYWQGFNVMARFQADAAGVPLFQHIARQINNVWPLLAAFFSFTLVLIFKRDQRSSAVWVLYAWGSILFFVYLANQHSWDDLRYFAPGYMVLVTGLLLIVDNGNLNKCVVNTGIGLLAGILIVVYASSGIPADINAIKHGYKHIVYQVITPTPPPPIVNCIPVLDAGRTIGFDFDYITNSLGNEGAKNLALSHNRKICGANKKNIVRNYLNDYSW